jgi:predicted secreted hydrolase
MSSARNLRRLAGLTLAACAMSMPACERERDGGPPIRASLQVTELLGGADTLHERATDVRPFSFPEDHGPHPAFRTEWWYFTGNLTADDGTELGYQLTFFRSALTDSASFAAAIAGQAHEAAAGADTVSAWRARHAWLAHFAVSDIGSGRIHAAERFARGAAGLAGAQASPFHVWLDAWSASGAGLDTTANASVTAVTDAAGTTHRGGVTHTGDAVHDGTFPLRLVAAAGDVAIDLVVQQGKPPVLQGENGLSRKGPEPGNASYYYSFTRMPTTGTVRIGGTVHRVQGASWLDREWSTSVLSPGITGWDWMALQLDDGTEVMLYRLRRQDGSAAPFSAGTFVDRDGTARTLAEAAFTLTPVSGWRSPIDGTRYPTAWQVGIPGLDLRLDVRAAFDAQELDLSVRYWEGAVRVRGTRAGRAVSGGGYLEMTGWAAGR